MPIKVGIVGLSAGGWAEAAHVAPLLKLKDQYELTACLTTRESSAKEATEKFKIKAYHGDPKQLAEDPNVELVVISVKVPAHKETLWPAIAAGKDVFCEWPLARDLQEAIEITNFAKDKGVRTMIGLQARYGSAVKKAAELVKASKIGKVLSTHVVSSFFGRFSCLSICIGQIASGGVWGPIINQRNAYTYDVENGANMLTIPFSHMLDGFSCVLGDFESLNASVSVQSPKATVAETNETITKTSYDQVLVQGKLQSGAVASIHFRGGASFSDKGATDFLWEIEGEDGVISLKGPGGHIQMFEPDVYLNGKKVELTEPDDLGNVGREYQAFAKGDASGYLDFEHAVARHKIVDAILRSSADGKRVKL